MPEPALPAPQLVGRANRVTDDACLTGATGPTGPTGPTGFSGVAGTEGPRLSRGTKARDAQVSRTALSPTAPLDSTSVRVLIIPGLRNSGPDHWQTWLEQQYVDAARVNQPDWNAPDLAQWSHRIDDTLARSSSRTQWIAVAHSFGCLALAHHLARRKLAQPTSAGLIAAAWMVAPANPQRFGVDAELPQFKLELPVTVVGSDNDPWMDLSDARAWAHRWGAGFINLGAAGHINAESGFGPWPLARLRVDHMVRGLRQRLNLRCQSCASTQVP